MGKVSTPGVCFQCILAQPSRIVLTLPCLQMQFHSSFERCVSRVLYKGEWSTSRPAIMKHNQWDKCSSEVLIRYAQPSCSPYTTCC